MNFRPFRCRFCGHRMKIIGGNCTRCYQPRALYQRGLPIAGTLAAAAGAVFLVLH